MDKALKQRLVGASVLIILAVIVLPMLLSGRSDRLKHETSSIELPPKPDELSIESRRFPVGIPNRPAPATGQEAVEETKPDITEPLQPEGAELASSGTESPDSVLQPESGSDEEQVNTTDLDELPAAGPGTAEPQEAAAVEVAPPAVSSITLASQKPDSFEISADTHASADAPRYLVQVASFSSEKNANVLAEQLRAENLPVLMDVVDRPAGRMYRVRVGPYGNRPEADALVSRLGVKMTDLNPRVLDLRPDESSPVSAPSDPLVRWVVQVGSFNSSESAADLVARLRLAGFNAYSEKVSSTSGSVYKVRIGPELDREQAAETARKVKAEHKLDAFVATQE